MPPPKGNLNSTKNGTRVDRNRLVVGELPKELTRVRNEARAYRRKLEQAVLDAHQEISTTASHFIDTAAACTAHAGIARWLLRNRLPEMKAGDILACSRELVRAKQARDQAVRMLDLDAPPPDPWAVIDLKQEDRDDAEED